MHPFRVGIARGAATPWWITGDTGGLIGSTGSITAAVPFGTAGNQVVLYCNAHSSMTLVLNIVPHTHDGNPGIPDPMPPPPPPPPPSASPHPPPPSASPHPPPTVSFAATAPSPSPEPEPEPEPESTGPCYSSPYVGFTHTGAPLQSLSSASGFGEATALCTQNSACHAVVEDAFPNPALAPQMRYVLRGAGTLQPADHAETVLAHSSCPPPSPPSPPPPSSAHAHAFQGVVYYMPDNFPGMQHGGDCPAHATTLSPKSPPPLAAALSLATSALALALSHTAAALSATRRPHLRRPRPRRRP